MKYSVTLPTYRMFVDESETFYGAEFKTISNPNWHKVIEPKHTETECRKLARQHLKELSK